MKPKNVRDIDFVLFCRLVAVCDDFDSAYGGEAELGDPQFDDIGRRVAQILMEIRADHAIVDPAEVPGGVDGSKDAALAIEAEAALRNEKLQALRNEELQAEILRTA